MERITCIFILFVFIGHICSCVVDCSLNTTGVHRFGSDCQHVCHCYNNSVCDKDTGVCPNKCDTNWFGSACQKRDIVAEQPNHLVRHSSNLQSDYQYAPRASDGATTTCSHTMEAHHSTAVPWWKVWFPQNETIQEVYVLTKTDILQYFPKFEVSVEFVPTENKDGISYVPEYKRTCYRHDATIPDTRPDLDSDTDPDTSMIYVQCEQPEVGNQVRIQLAEIESQLVLCDARISKECAVNKWGPLCENSCGACRNTTCDVVTGTCYGGCQDGFEYTDRCTTDKSPLPGSTYLNCMPQPCDKVNGECIGGCKAGYRGNRCEQDCKDGTYGNGCTNVCSVHCANVCNKVTGTCSCKAGYKGLLCDEECDYGTYGLNCTADCGHCQTNTFCHKVTGICESGCMKGYTGTKCLYAKVDLQIATIAGTSVGGVAIIFATVILVCVVMYKRRQPQPAVKTLISISAPYDLNVLVHRKAQPNQTISNQMETATNRTASSDDDSNILRD